MSDAPFLNRLRKEFGRTMRLFRNEVVGAAWTAPRERVFHGPSDRPIRLQEGDVLLRNPKRFNAGLYKGSSDLVGWRPLTITEEMVGQQVAQFVSIEAKEGAGRLSEQQRRWLETVERQGGFAIVARSVEDVRRALELREGGRS